MFETQSPLKSPNFSQSTPCGAAAGSSCWRQGLLSIIRQRLSMKVWQRDHGLCTTTMRLGGTRPLVVVGSKGEQLYTSVSGAGAPLTYRLLVPVHIEHNVNAHRALIAFASDPRLQDNMQAVDTRRRNRSER